MHERFKLTVEPEILLSDEIKIPIKKSIDQLGVGEQLIRARTKQNLTIVQIADQLKWSLRQITEIEAGNYAVLPDPASVRGFVRSYAKKLKLDAAPLLESLLIELNRLPTPFPTHAADRPIPEAFFSIICMSWLGRQHNKLYRMLGLLLLLVSLVVLFLFQAEAGFLMHDLVTKNKEISVDTPISVVVRPDALIGVFSVTKSIFGIYKWVSD